MSKDLTGIGQRLGPQAARAFALMIAVFATPSLAGDFSLFNPTPDDHLRPLNSDRPTQTQGAFTIDPGHVQLEASFIEYFRDDSGDPGIQQFSILPSDIRIGLSTHVEADLLVRPVLLQRRASNGQHQNGDSFGDTTVQAKINLVGDDDGPLCVTVVPFLITPTASRSSGIGTGYVQGGVMLPAQYKLPKDFMLQGMIEVDANRSDDNARYGEAFVESILLTRTFGFVGPYVEFYGSSPRQLGHSYRAYLDGGATFKLTDNLQLDFAVDVGVSHASRGYTLLAGITVRR